MLIKKCVIELEDLSFEELQKVQEFIKNIKSKNAVLENTEDNGNDNNTESNVGTDNIDDDNLKRLKKLRDNLTAKQHVVFKFFMDNPGPIYGDVLKSALPILQAQGALPGVFKATRRWMRLGGDKKNSPFVQIDWDRVRGCGIYRGLTSEEIEYLKTV